MLKATPKNTGAKGVGSPKSAVVVFDHTRPATLKEIGIDKDTSLSRKSSPRATARLGSILFT